jgi:hypothetical protein
MIAPYFSPVRFHAKLGAFLHVRVPDSVYQEKRGAKLVKNPHYTPSKVARNPFGINETSGMRFHPYGWAAGPWELKTPAQQVNNGRIIQRTDSDVKQRS